MCDVFVVCALLPRTFRRSRSPGTEQNMMRILYTYNLIYVDIVNKNVNT